MLEKLFNQIGVKIKIFAQWCFIVEAVGSVITGIGLLFDEFILAGLLTMLCGPIVAWVSSWILYGFGELVDANMQQKEYLKRLNVAVQALAEPSLLKKAEEQAQREAEAKAKRESAARTKREADEKAKREAEERAQRRADEREQRRAEELARLTQQSTAPKEKALWEKLEFALRYQTDDGMLGYLNKLDDEQVQKILSGPQELIREKVSALAEQLKKQS